MARFAQAHHETSELALRADVEDVRERLQREASRLQQAVAATDGRIGPVEASVVQLQASHTAALTQIDVYGAQVPPVRPTYIFALARPRTNACTSHAPICAIVRCVGPAPEVRTALSGRSNDGVRLAWPRCAWLFEVSPVPFDTSALGMFHGSRRSVTRQHATCNIRSLAGPAAQEAV